MKKILIFIELSLFITTLSYGQCACCAGAGTGSSNGDYNNGILTLEKKQWTIEGYADYRSIKEGDEHGHTHHETEEETEEETPLKNMLISSLGIRYGISDKVTVAALLPYAFLHTDTGNDKGIGDLILLSTISIFSKNNFNLAVQIGVELPTGIQKGSNFDNTTVVLGSGSFDPLAGIIFSKRWNKITLQGNGLFKNTTDGFQGNNYGSVAVQNLSLAYHLKGENSLNVNDNKDFNNKKDFGCTVLAGYYGEWLDKINEDNVVDENSGYYLGFANLGTNLSYKKWRFPLTVSIPMIQNMNGDQNDSGLRMRLGIIKSF